MANSPTNNPTLAEMAEYAQQRINERQAAQREEKNMRFAQAYGRSNQRWPAAEFNYAGAELRLLMLYAEEDAKLTAQMYKELGESEENTETTLQMYRALTDENDVRPLPLVETFMFPELPDVECLSS